MNKLEWVETNGIGLRVVQAGNPSGPLVILLHGFPEDSRAWEAIVPGLSAAGFWVWSPDQRGYFQSEKPNGASAYKFDELAADIAGLVAAAARKKVILVGHDWGASVAWWVVFKYPEMVERLVVLCGAHVKVAYDFRRRNFSQLIKNWYAIVFLLPGLPELLGKATGWGILTGYLRSSAKPGAWSAAQLDAYKKAWAMPGTFRSMVNWYRSFVCHAPKFKDDMRVLVPTLLIWGEEDNFVPITLGELSLALCDKGKFVVMKNATHWLHHEQPAEVLRLICQFLICDDKQPKE